MTILHVNESSESDLKSALSKLQEVAGRYESKNYLANIWLGFQSISMPLTEFHEQLKRNWELMLSGPEVHALVRYFADDANTEELNCSKFTTHFFRAGQKDREERLGKHLARQYYLKKHREDMERDLVGKLVQSKSTRVVWPDLSQSLCPSPSSLHNSTSLNSGDFSDANNATPARPKRRTRKPTLMESMSFSQLSFSMNDPFDVMYPNASKDTKVSESVCV